MLTSSDQMVHRTADPGTTGTRQSQYSGYSGYLGYQLHMNRRKENQHPETADVSLLEQDQKTPITTHEDLTCCCPTTPDTDSILFEGPRAYGSFPVEALGLGALTEDLLRAHRSAALLRSRGWRGLRSRGSCRRVKLWAVYAHKPLSPVMWGE